ncbi:hypothetical protein GGI07_001454 [Coemansia sp. Benny D115]|nr:hypothetical protein GGI07_001454 [Coemansia sp. Benny D115]
MAQGSYQERELARLAANHPSRSTAPSVGFGTMLMQSLTRAKATITMQTLPPDYSRGAWGIISDVPFPAPPPYAGYSRHPPSYEEALEIGLIASPLRVEQQQNRRNHFIRRSPISCTAAPSINLDSDDEDDMGSSLPRVSSAPQLSALLESSETYHGRMTIGGILFGEDVEFADEPLPEAPALPSYYDEEDSVCLCPVVSGWKLGEPAFEKPPRHPRGYVYADAADESSMETPAESNDQTTDSL